MSILKRFLKPIKKIKGTRAIGFFVMINWFLFDLVTVVATKEIGELVESGNTIVIKNILIAYLIYFVISYIIKYATRNWSAKRTNYTLMKIIWRDVFEKYFRFDISATEKIGTGKMINIISKGVKSRADMNQIIQYTLSDIVVKLLIVGYLLTQLDIIYTVLFLALFVFLLRFSSWIYNNKVVILRREKKNLAVRNSGHMVRMLMSKIEILQINRIQEEIDKYIQLISEQEQIAYRNMKWVFWMFNSSLIAVHAFFPLIIVYVITSLHSGTFSYGMFVGLSVAAGTLGQFILKTTDAYKKLLDYFIDIEKLRETIDNTPAITGYNTGDDFGYSNGDIKVEKVTFAYGEQGEKNAVFTNFGVSIEGGKRTALVGMSGSGKSTLVKLIAGYLRPDSGHILIDNQDLTAVSLKSYYKHIGYLTQEPSVFDGTILDNLTYAIDGDVDPEQLEKCIRLAKCEFVRDFPKGVETEIGERGIRLSGGQRQRLAIAKIFLKDPKIIILDEPTSALDSFSEEAITEAMHNLFKERTVIIIAHRLQTVKNADDIIVLDEGKVIERGTHDELVEEGGSYAKMLELQSGF